MEARERERQASSIRREFTLSAELLQRYGAGNSENVVPGPPEGGSEVGRQSARKRGGSASGYAIYPSTARRPLPLLGFHLPARTRTRIWHGNVN